MAFVIPGAYYVPSKFKKKKKKKNKFEGQRDAPLRKKDEYWDEKKTKEREKGKRCGDMCKLVHDVQVHFNHRNFTRLRERDSGYVCVNKAYAVTPDVRVRMWQLKGL